MSHYEDLKVLAQQRREDYIEALTQCVMQAMEDAGCHVEQGSRAHQELHDAVETAAR